MSKHTGSPWQSVKKHLPVNVWEGTETLKYRCHNCQSISHVPVIGHVENGDSWAFPCSNCGAKLGPGGDHPGRMRVTSPAQKGRRSSVDQKAAAYSAKILLNNITRI